MTDPCRTLDVVLTRSCNLQCDYCPIVPAQDEPGPDIEKVLKSVSAFFSAHLPFDPAKPAPHLVVNITGGEPLLRLDAVKMLVNAINIICASTGLFIDVTLKTNLLLLDAETLDYLVLNNVTILPRIDGCPKAHDTWRSVDGESTWGQVTENAVALLQKQPNAVVQMAVTPQTIDKYAESIFDLYGLGFKHIHPVFPSLEPMPSESFAALDIQVRKICDWWVGIVQGGGDLTISWIEQMYRALEAGKPVATCKPCVERLAIGPTGTLYPCYAFALSPLKHWNLANVKNTERMERLFGDAENAYMNDRPSQCSDCELKDYCLPSCYWRAVATKSFSACCGKGVRIKPTGDFCQIQRIYFAEAVRAFRILRGEPVE